MRKSHILDALVSGTKQKILAAILLQPERSWYLLELARHLHLQPSSLQRELRLLSDAGILKRNRSGNRVYFQADTASPIYRPLAEIIFKTVGVVEALKEALQPLKKQVEVAFIYGSIAEASERTSSDVDVMVIGAATLSAIAPLLRGPERRLGRAINPAVYTPEEFTRRVQEKNHFLTTVLQKELLFIMGGQSELAKFVANAKNQTSPDQLAGAKRPARHR